MFDVLCCLLSSYFQKNLQCMTVPNKNGAIFECLKIKSCNAATKAVHSLIFPAKI